MKTTAEQIHRAFSGDRSGTMGNITQEDFQKIADSVEKLKSMNISMGSLIVIASNK